jgi:hypothetical protein
MLAQAEAAAVVRRSAAKSPGTFVSGRQPRPFGMRHSGVADDLRSDFDQLLVQARQRPILDRLGCRRRAEKVAKVIGERMKLERHGIGRERPARQPRPIDRTLAFLDPLFARAALVVEDDDPLSRAAHVRDDEADARMELARVPLDLGDHPARFGLASRLIPEVGVVPTHLVRRPPDWALVTPAAHPEA